MEQQEMDQSNIKIEPGKRHVCQECGSSFSRPYRLLQHMLVHRNIRPFACGETNCSKSYTSKSHLDRHILTVHIKPDFVVINSCPVCMKVFSNRQNLKRHIKIAHMSEKEKFTCDVCRTDFKKKHLLTSHMYQHTFVKSFSCDFCTRDFVSLHEKKKHQKHHKTYNCDLCDMAFAHWSKYLKHKQDAHQANEFICNECGRKFKQRQHIVRHVKIHMSQPVFKCWYQDCNRFYTRHSNLRQHIRIKHMELTHPCDICGVRLCTKAKLQLHIKAIHTEPKVKAKQPTLADGRKPRKDKGIPRSSTALKLAGLNLNSAINNVQNDVENMMYAAKNEIATESVDSPKQAHEFVEIVIDNDQNSQDNSLFSNKIDGKTNHVQNIEVISTQRSHEDNLLLSGKRHNIINNVQNKQAQEFVEIITGPKSSQEEDSLFYTKRDDNTNHVNDNGVVNESGAVYSKVPIRVEGT